MTFRKGEKIAPLALDEKKNARCLSKKVAVQIWRTRKAKAKSRNLLQPEGRERGQSQGAPISPRRINPLSTLLLPTIAGLKGTQVGWKTHGGS